MTVESALEAIKRKDFTAARALIGSDYPSFTLQQFQIKGLAELACHDWQAARETFTIALDHFCTQSSFWLNRAIASENLGLIDEAIDGYEKCLALPPIPPEAYGNLSHLYRRRRRFGDAQAMAQLGLDKGLAKGDSLNALGLALWQEGKFEAAKAALEEAHQADSTNAHILANLANLACDQLRFETAWPLFAQARALEDLPVIRRDEGMAHLLAGDYQRGWELFESRLDLPKALRFLPPCPRWKGEPLEGKKILILAEQGFGDVIQFSRYQTFLPSGDLIWAVPAPLIRLLSHVLRGTVLDETGPLPACDFYTPLLSLPLLTDHVKPVASTLALKPSEIPLLPQGAGKRKIGLVWAGSRTHERDHERSITLQALQPLLQEHRYDFYAVSTADTSQEIGDRAMIRLDPLIGDFADTAALLRQLDCLISVDTAVAHLAGTLGVKTFLLLPYCPDWRWGPSGETTPWYQSMTLLRQPVYGDWASVIQKVVTLLEGCF